MMRAQRTTERLLSLAALAEAAECLKTLAHPHRLRMVQMLLRGRYTVGELARACEIASHVASEHLRLMQRCGFLAHQKEGRTVYYQIAEPHLANILACVEARFGAERSESVSKTGRIRAKRENNRLTRGKEDNHEH